MPRSGRIIPKGHVKRPSNAVREIKQGTCSTLSLMASSLTLRTHRKRWLTSRSCCWAICNFTRTVKRWALWAEKNCIIFVFRSTCRQTCVILCWKRWARGENWLKRSPWSWRWWCLSLPTPQKGLINDYFVSIININSGLLVGFLHLLTYVFNASQHCVLVSLVYEPLLLLAFLSD